MSSCCGSPDRVLPAVAPRCPQSGTKGLAVDLFTVKALLCESALRAVREGPYRFCADPTCAVVYFDGEGHVFNAADLRVPIWQKHPAGARMICYCFDENETSMALEFAQVGVAPRSECGTISPPVAAPAKCGTRAGPAAWAMS